MGFSLRKKKEVPVRLVGLLQALEVTLYCGLIGLLFWKGNEIFGKMDRLVAPVMFLVLFIVSALICTLMVFYYPYLLFFEKGMKKQAMEVVVWTTGWLAVFLLGFMLLAVLF